ncbi:MAG: SDR family oxidoreductase [Pseudomonadota bacterium]
MSSHENKTYLVTGGTTGIGAATVAYLAAAGATVIATGRSPATLEAARNSAADNVEIVQSDAGSLADITALAAHIADNYGKLDGAFINAGIAPFMPLEAWQEADFDQLFAVNVKGPFFLTQALAPLINKGGAIVFTTSVINAVGLGTASAYGATKGALRSLVRSLSVELAPHGLRVNAIAPGPVESPIYDKLGMEKAALDEFAAHMSARVPLQRFGQGADIAAAAAYLLSDEAGFVTGEEIRVDGGMRNNVA